MDMQLQQQLLLLQTATATTTTTASGRDAYTHHPSPLTNTYNTNGFWRRDGEGGQSKLCKKNFTARGNKIY